MRADGITFVLLHGAGDSGRSWHLVVDELRSRGHQGLAPDLPCEDESSGLAETVDAVLEAIGERHDVVVVGHSLGGIVAPLVAQRIRARALVYLAAMVPAPGERAGDWWEHVGYDEAVRTQAARDGGLTGNPDPYVAFYNGVPRDVAQEAMSRSRGQSARSMEDPWPLDAHPDLPTRFLLLRDDHFFPADLLRQVAQERLGVEAEEVPGGHCAMLSHPRQIADALLRSVG